MEKTVNHHSAVNLCTTWCNTNTFLRILLRAYGSKTRCKMKEKGKPSASHSVQDMMFGKVQNAEWEVSHYYHTVPSTHHKRTCISILSFYHLIHFHTLKLILPSSSPSYRLFLLGQFMHYMYILDSNINFTLLTLFINKQSILYNLWSQITTVDL